MGVSAAIIGGSLIGAGAGLGGAALSSSAAGKAANTQAAAANNVADLQHQDAQAALQFQEQQYLNSLGLIQPYYQSGTNAMSTLDQLLGLPGVQGNSNVFSNPAGLPPAQLPGATPAGIGGGGNPGRFALSLPATAQGASSLSDFAGGFPLRNGGINSVGGANGPPRFDLNGNPIIQANGGPAQLSVPNPNAPASPNATGPNGTIGSTGLNPGFLSQTFNQPFIPPDAVTEQNDPGFKFRLSLGQQALENSAAARGGLLSGGTAKALNDFAQNDASAEYGNVYNRALTNYQTAYNTFNQNQANIFNRYAALAGIGQTSAGQLANAGLTSGGQVGNTLLTSGAQIGQQLNNAAAARASGYVGGANAYANAFGSLGQAAQLIPLYNLLNQNGGLSATEQNFLNGGGGPTAFESGVLAGGSA